MRIKEPPTKWFSSTQELTEGSWGAAVGSKMQGQVSPAVKPTCHQPGTDMELTVEVPGSIHISPPPVSLRCFSQEDICRSVDVCNAQFLLFSVSLGSGNP